MPRPLPSTSVLMFAALAVTCLLARSTASDRNEPSSSEPGRELRVYVRRAEITTDGMRVLSSISSVMADIKLVDCRIAAGAAQAFSRDTSLRAVILFDCEVDADDISAMLALPRVEYASLAGTRADDRILPGIRDARWLKCITLDYPGGAARKDRVNLSTEALANVRRQRPDVGIAQFTGSGRQEYEVPNFASPPKVNASKSERFPRERIDGPTLRGRIGLEAGKTVAAFRETTLDSDAWHALSEMSWIEHVHVESVAVGPTELKCLAAMPGLDYLELKDVDVEPEALECFIGHPTLQFLVLDRRKHAAGK